MNLDHLYNPAAAQKFFGKNYFVDKKLHFKIIERGTIIPHKHMWINGEWTWGFGGIVDEKNNFVKDSHVVCDMGEAYTPLEEVQHSSATVIYFGLLFRVWGHIITNHLSRLWFLKSEIFEKYFKDCPIVYNPWGGYFHLNVSKIFGGCLRFWKSTSTACTPSITPCSSTISSCPTTPSRLKVLRPSTARRLTA